MASDGASDEMGMEQTVASGASGAAQAAPNETAATPATSAPLDVTGAAVWAGVSAASSASDGAEARDTPSGAERPSVPSSTPLTSPTPTPSTPAAPVPTASSPAGPEPVPVREGSDDFDRYYAVRLYQGNLALSPDGQQVAYLVNTSGQFNIWRQPITGGWPTQVTTFERETARMVLWSPAGDLIGMADADGAEQYQVFAVPSGGGAVRYFTARPDVQYQVSPRALAPDGRRLVYAGNERVPTDADVFVRDLDTGQTRTILANGRLNVPVNWSPDGRQVTVLDVRSNTDLHLWLVDAASGSATEVLPHEEEFFLVPGPWLPDSSGFYLITDRGREFKGVARFNLATQDLTWVLTPDWDVEHLELSHDGRRMVWVLNEGGASQLYVRDANQSALRVAGLPRGVIEDLTLTPDGRTMALRINGPTAAAEIYVITLDDAEAGAAPAAPRLRRLTYGMLGGLGADDLVTPEPVSIPSPDGRDIPAWLYRPRQADAARVPALLAIHGGPEAQERIEYHALYQYLLARGIAILAPNIRGSTGYGLAYQRQIHRDWGGGDLRDIEAAARYLRGLAWVDSERLGVYGGSFGGFATLSAATRLPEYWSAAVDICGPSNLITFARAVPPTWRRFMARWVGDPDTEADFLRERSPITYIDQTRAPLLILQGANDPRVVKAESDQMVERLRGLGRSVEYVVFADEGHGFAKRRNQLEASRLTADFLLRHLLGESVG